MKKLTNRVLAGGLWFDVPLGAQYVSIDEVGYAQSHELEPAISGDTWAAGGYDCALGFVELEGEDWRSCRWYVGDQVDGEAVERREWMARRVESFVEYNQALASDYPGAMVAKALGVTEVNAECHSQRIRLGEVDCE